MDNVLHRLKNKIKAAKDVIKEEILTPDPLIIVPYRGYSNGTKLWLRGRILEDENIFEGKSESEIRNLIDTFKRFETDEYPDAKVNLSINDQSIETVSDEEGYFTFETTKLHLPQDNKKRWLELNLESQIPKMPLLSNTAEVFLPSSTAQYGIITDMDDTVLQTHVTSMFRLKMLYYTFFKDAEQRLPMEGMVKLFEEMVAGKDGQRENPVFYVSNSPWNIYDILEEFLHLQKLPKGPILLRDYGIKPNVEFFDHKRITIRRILKMYPNLPFIMLGDTASKDADYYIELAKEFPGQIKAVYIRQTKRTNNALRVAELIKKNAGINAVLVHSSDDIRRHAQSIGLMTS